MSWQSLVDVNLNTVSEPGWCLAFAKDAVGAPAGIPTARASWDIAQDKHPGDWNLPDAVCAVYWSWVGDLGEGMLDYGHVCIWVPGRGLFSSPKRWTDGVGSAWYSSIDEVSNWIGGTYLGWTSDINGKQICQWVGDAPAPAPVVESNQRVTGADGANRREAPSSQSAMLEPSLSAGEIGNFVGFTRGEDPYGNGNNIWFRGISGNYFYSGAFTYSGTDGLADLDAPAEPPSPSTATPAHIEEPPTVLVPVEELYPDLTPAPAEPTPTPEPVKETPVPEISDEKKKDIQNKQEAFAGGITPISLGSIITNPRTRKIVWAVYGITGLVLLAIVGGMNNAGWLSPDWFLFIMGSYIALGPAFSGLAIANIKE